MKRLPATIVMEMAALSVGIIMPGLELAVLINRDWLGPAAVELFRGGEPAAIIVVLAIVLGFLALVLFAINLVAGRRALWWQRCILAVGFLLTVSFFGNMLQPAIATVTCDIGLARYACGHHISRAPESQRR